MMCITFNHNFTKFVLFTLTAETVKEGQIPLLSFRARPGIQDFFRLFLNLNWMPDQVRHDMQSEIDKLNNNAISK